MKHTPAPGGVALRALLALASLALAPAAARADLVAEYYNNTDFTGFVASEVVPNINYDWGLSSPHPNVGTNTFSVRWTGSITPAHTETYVFQTENNDAVRVWVNDVLVINNWGNNQNNQSTGILPLTGGVAHRLRVDYYDSDTYAKCKLFWSSPSQAREVVPASALATTQPARRPVIALRADDLVDMVGVNTHLTYDNSVYYDQYTTIIKPKLQALGVRRVRDGYVLADYSYKKNRVKDIAASGYLVDVVAPAANFGDTTVSTATLETIYQDLSGNVAGFESYNEPDIFLGSTWVSKTQAYTQSLFTSAKASSIVNQVPIMGPSIVWPTSWAAVGDLSAYMDYGNFHPYAAANRPMRTVNNEGFWRTLKESRLVNGYRPVKITEFGYHTALGAGSPPQPPVTEPIQARYLLRSLTEYFRAGVQAAYLYEFIDLFSDPDNNAQESNWGILDNDGREKPAYVAIKNLLALFNDPGVGATFTPGALDYSITGSDLANIHHLLLQRSDGDFYLVLCQEVTSYDIATRTELSVTPRNITLNFHQPVQSGAVFDPENASAAVSTFGAVSSLALAVPDRVTVVRITPAPAEVAASADTYARGGSYSNTNYGGSSVLQVKRTVTGASTDFYRVAYLRFDLSGLTADVAGAWLRVKVAALGGEVAPGTPRPIEIYRTEDTAWTETGLTWNARPAAITPRVADFSVSQIGEVKEIDLTTLINARRSAGTLTLALSQPTNTNLYVEFHSREAGATNGPVLVIDS